MTGATFGDKHTDSWGLKLLQTTIGFPEAKIFKIDKPAGNGSWDVTDYITGGDVKYSERTIQMTFDALGDYSSWHALVSGIAGYLHGRRLKIIMDTDPSFYYIGRLSVDTEKSNAVTHRVVITGTVDPYKYEITSSTEDWLWDTFSFVDGVIRDYRNIEINGEHTLIIPGRRKRVPPIFTCTAPMTVTYLGVTHDLHVGNNSSEHIVLGEGDHELIFHGHGVVTVEYRGASL